MIVVDAEKSLHLFVRDDEPYVATLFGDHRADLALDLLPDFGIPGGGFLDLVHFGDFVCNDLL